MIYISYFANIKNIPQGIEVVGICHKMPPWLQDRNLRNITDLAPTGQILRLYKKGEIVWDTYVAMYKRDVLSQIDLEDILNQIGDNTCLCCYEANGDKCHRYIVADWLRHKGVEVSEI